MHANDNNHQFHEAKIMKSGGMTYACNDLFKSFKGLRSSIALQNGMSTDHLIWNAFQILFFISSSLLFIPRLKKKKKIQFHSCTDIQTNSRNVTVI